MVAGRAFHAGAFFPNNTRQYRRKSDRCKINKTKFDKAKGHPQRLSARQRRAAVEGTWHQAFVTPGTVRHLCGSGADRQSTFPERDASHRRSRGEIHRSGTGCGNRRAAARLAALDGLAVAREYLGSPDKVKRIVQLGVSVATSGDVRDQPQVADGASELLQGVFGKDKNPSRLVYGAASLPLGAPTALEIIFEV